MLPAPSLFSSRTGENEELHELCLLCLPGLTWQMKSNLHSTAYTVSNLANLKDVIMILVKYGFNVILFEDL